MAPKLMRLLHHDGIEGSEGSGRRKFWPIQHVVCSPRPSHVPWPKGHRRIEIMSAGALPYLKSSVDKRQPFLAKVTVRWVVGGSGTQAERIPRPTEGLRGFALTGPQESS